LQQQLNPPSPKTRAPAYGTYTTDNATTCPRTDARSKAPPIVFIMRRKQPEARTDRPRGRSMRRAPLIERCQQLLGILKVQPIRI
jgi:uncharacterized protein YcsI (UPF0317 family)